MPEIRPQSGSHAQKLALMMLVGVFFGVSGVGIGGCAVRTRPGVQGQTGIVANYQGRQLRAHLPCWVQVPSAAAAAQRVLTTRGLTISHSKVDMGSALVLGTPAGANPNPLVMRQRVRVNIGVDEECTWVNILVEPVGNEAQSRSILEQMLFELGL